MAHTRWSQVPPISGNALPHPRALTCTMTMAAGHKEPEAAL